MSETNEEAIVDATTNEEEGSSAEGDTISVSKADWEKSQQTIGSMKREIKDLKKPKETETSTPNTKPEESVLVQKLEKMTLRQAGITDPEDVELAQKTAKKWGVDIEDVVEDEDFKMKLERQRNSRTNVMATSKVKGGTGTSQTKNTPEYWQSLGRPPSREEVPDRATRIKIQRSFMSGTGNNKVFYND